MTLKESMDAQIYITSSYNYTHYMLPLRLALQGTVRFIWVNCDHSVISPESVCHSC